MQSITAMICRFVDVVTDCMDAATPYVPYAGAAILTYIAWRMYVGIEHTLGPIP